MRLYVDTSVLVAAHTHEPQTQIAQAWLAVDAGDLLVSAWTLLECESALAIKLRRGELTGAGRSEAIAGIDTFVAQSAPVIVPTEADFQRSRELCRHAASRLRAGDSLHLAIALRVKATHFAALDQVLATNAAVHGFAMPTSPGRST